MHTEIQGSATDRRPAWQKADRVLRRGLPLLASLAFCAPAPAQGLSYGPFTLNAFAKYEGGRANNQAKDV